jgi:hypothetical protein
VEIRSSKHFVIEHLQGKINTVQEPLRRNDYMIGFETLYTLLLATSAATNITELYGNLRSAIRASVTNGSKLPVQSRVWVGTELEPLEWVVTHEKT